MKILNKRLANDEALLTVEGALGVAAGLTMIVSPKTAHEHVFDKAKSGGMTRVAGASLAAASTYAMRAGYHGTPAERRTAFRITAVHSALGAGLGLAQLSAKKSEAVMDKDKLKVATGLLMCNAAYFGYRAAKSKSII